MDTTQKVGYRCLGEGTKMATKLLPKIRHLKYADRLKTCKLPTMHYRRIRAFRGDMMIETCKILSGKYDSAAIPILTTYLL